jgi:hypothetical protein
MNWMHRLKRVFAIDIEICPTAAALRRYFFQQREELNGSLARAPPGHQEPTFNLIGWAVGGSARGGFRLRDGNGVIAGRWKRRQRPCR